MADPIDIEMSTAARKKPGVSFYILWVLLTPLCIPLAYVLSFLPLSMIIRFTGDFIYVNGVQHITEDYLGIYIIVPMIGLLTGLAQYGMLRSYLPHMGGWVLVTTGGWVLGLLSIALLNRLEWIDTARILDATFLLMGLCIGVAQWLHLRQRLPRAGWWIAANVVGWGLLVLITKENFIDQYGMLTVGFVPACITAVTLGLLLNRFQTKV